MYVTHFVLCIYKKNKGEKFSFDLPMMSDNHRFLLALTVICLRLFILKRKTYMCVWLCTLILYIYTSVCVCVYAHVKHDVYVFMHGFNFMWARQFTYPKD